MARKTPTDSSSPPERGALTVELPAPMASEIEDVARRTRSSTGFIVRRALAVQKAPAAGGSAPEGARASLVLTALEDDPPDLLARIRAAGEGAALGALVTAAWAASRERFLRWAEREEQTHASEASGDADDLDGALRDARAKDTPAERLSQLASSEYPRVRALVAAHPRTPAAALERLASDREPVVRNALAARPASA